MTFPHLRLSANPHDRAAVRRTDEAWLDQQWADPATRVLVVVGTRIRPVAGQAEWVTPAQAPDGLRVLLGEQDGAARFAVIVDAETAGVDTGDWQDLRSLLLASGEPMPQMPLVLHAVGLAEWLAVTRYCARCGEPVVPRAAGHELVCVACGRTHFPRTDPAVIMLVTHGLPGTAEERCLLGHQAVWPEHRYSTLAGFCEPGETLEDAVRREVAEEVGVRVGEVTYFGNQPWPFPSSLMFGFRAVAETTEITVDTREIADARWFTREEMRSAARAGDLLLPRGVSIARSLVEHWYGGDLPGQW